MKDYLNSLLNKYCPPNCFEFNDCLLLCSGDLRLHYALERKYQYSHPLVFEQSDIKGECQGCQYQNLKENLLKSGP